MDFIKLVVTAVILIAHLLILFASDGAGFRGLIQPELMDEIGGYNQGVRDMFDVARRYVWLETISVLVLSGLVATSVFRKK